MANQNKLTRTFLAGKMNKMLDSRLVPKEEYIDALNIRMGSTELDNVGVIENTKGNLVLTELKYTDGNLLSNTAKCIGAFEDGTNETLYWFVHDPDFSIGDNGLLDLIVSYNTNTDTLTYHVISIDDGLNAGKTTLNFNSKYLITGVNKIDDFLIFTDDYNPPRLINVTKSYPLPSIANVDDPLLAEMLLVIKRPPLQAPQIETIKTAGKEIFLKERFVCFAYRYKYENGEYSATSQFTAPTFIPEQFNLSLDSYLNEGMTNYGNAVIISYNTGGKLVKGIDLLFKEMVSNVIKVIEKLDKEELGFADNVVKTYVFNNSKIFTILPDSELLRLYDNVPRFAKAQTLIGNRLMYGDYVEGYDLLSLDNGELKPTKLTFFTDLISETISSKTIPAIKKSGTYTIDTHVGQQTIQNCVGEVDLTSVINSTGLKSGGSLNIEFTIKHSSFTTTNGVPTEVTQSINLSFTFFLYSDYQNAYDMATNLDGNFLNTVGYVGNIKPVYTSIVGELTSCEGTTFTDQVNCLLPNNLNSWIKYNSGINGVNEAIKVIANPSTPNKLSLQMLCMHYVDNVVIPTQHVYEYYQISNIYSRYNSIAIPQSLHSNRGYEIGIVYEDEFKRASTVLVSRNNTQYIPCDKSNVKNSIQVTIPVSQIAPSWAKRYKFVIKQDQENYETIYSNIAFKDPSSNAAYFLLEGENARKVEVNNRLIVKSDSGGVIKSCVFTTVLEKGVKGSNFISIPNPLNTFLSLPIPSGVYMKMNPNNYSAGMRPDSIQALGQTESGVNDDDSGGPDYPTVIYNVNKYNPITGLWEDYDIPKSSKIVLWFQFDRGGADSGFLGLGHFCQRRIMTYSKTFTSSNNYANFKDWWDGSNIASTLNDSVNDIDGGAPPNNNIYYQSFLTTPSLPAYYFNNLYQFYRNPTTNQLSLIITSGTPACTGDGGSRRSNLRVNIGVIRANTFFIFETVPTDALPDIFYENNLSFGIGEFGNHFGNLQNQNFDNNLPAVIDTGFFNCYCFGNGAESFKIRDSIVGKTINLGNRVTSVAEEEYKEANRFADITYSGVYNNETNVNKLNEFNLGLLNFKKLENSFGAICLLDARMTDILVLQEDKISYVLTGKNLLSDSTGGGSITSVPEVLGTQIARTEKYGSIHPESYVHWGTDRYFTDAKRGAVIQLKGAESGSDQLKVISESGMRTWFRDIFINNINTQKLGGFDPYSNEYVLTTNSESIPIKDVCIPCGVSRTFNISENIERCIEINLVGTIEIAYVVPVGTIPFEIKVIYNNVEYTTGEVVESGTLEFEKDSNLINTFQLQILTANAISIEVFIPCATIVPISIVEVVITNSKDAGKYIHNEYNMLPVQSNITQFATGTNSPLVSKYNLVSGHEGQSGFPIAGDTMRLATNKIGFDDFDFNPVNNKFKYLRSDTLYANTQADLISLLATCIDSTPNVIGGNYNYSEFTVPSTGDYLYLVWDLRDTSEIDLCYSNISELDACCNCTPCRETCGTYFIANATQNALVYYHQCDGSSIETVLSKDSPIFICADLSYPITISEGYATVTQTQSCGCDNCEGAYNVFMVTIDVLQNITWTDYDNVEHTQLFEAGIYEFTVLNGTYPIPEVGMNISFVECIQEIIPN